MCRLCVFSKSKTKHLTYHPEDSDHRKTTWLVGKQDSVNWENSASGCRRPGDHVTISQSHELGSSLQVSCLTLTWRCVFLDVLSQISSVMFLAWIAFLTCLKIKQKHINWCLKLVGLSQDMLCTSSHAFPMPPYCNKMGRSLLVSVAWVSESDLIVISVPSNYKICYS